VLFPTVIAALYWKRTHAGAAIASIIVGEGLVVAYHFGLLPTLGTLPVVPIVVISALVLIAGSLVLPYRPKHPTTWEPRTLSRRAIIGWSIAFAGLFFVAHDVWSWGDGRLSWLGFPWWVWFFAGLCVVTSGALGLLSRQLAKHSTD